MTDKFFNGLISKSLALATLLLIPLAVLKKGDVVLYLNDHHTPFFDFLFGYGTLLGSGLIFLPILIYTLFNKFRFSAITLITFAVQAIFCVLMKKVIFNGALRPKAFFGSAIDLVEVEGITHYSYNTFPSGHTATAFSAALLLLLILGNRRLWFPMMLLALIVAASRIYLAQHFYMDVAAGAILGVGCTGLVWLLAENLHWPVWGQKKIEIQRPELSADR